MTPKEKAKELFDLFNAGKNSTSNSIKAMSEMLAEEYALECVNQICEYRRQLEKEYDEDFYHVYGVEEFWEQVKQEIKNS